MNNHKANKYQQAMANIEVTDNMHTQIDAELDQRLQTLANRQPVPFFQFHWKPFALAGSAALVIVASVLIIWHPTFASRSGTDSTDQPAQNDNLMLSMNASYLAPSSLPSGYTQVSVANEADAVQIIYTSAADTLTYNVCWNQSADYSVSEDNTTAFIVNSMMVRLTGDGTRFTKACWSDSENQYSLTSVTGITEADISLIINSMSICYATE